MNFGLALGGGGARGLAHIGVLEVLEEHGLKPTIVAGTSIGSIVGAFYCLHGSAQGLRAKARAMVQSEEFKQSHLDKFYTSHDNTLERFKKEVLEKFYFGQLFFKKSHIKNATAQKLFNDLFGNRTFADFKIRFVCNALDIQSGEEIIFTAGPITEAVWASCAIPGIVPPFVDNKKIAIDGSVINNIPIEPIKRLGTKIVLAIYLGDRPTFEDEPDTGYKISQRALLLMRYHIDQRILRFADLVIKPDVTSFHWANFSALDELVQKGREATLKNIKEIKSTISFWYRIKKLLR